MVFSIVALGASLIALWRAVRAVKLAKTDPDWWVYQKVQAHDSSISTIRAAQTDQWEAVKKLTADLGYELTWKPTSTTSAHYEVTRKSSPQQEES